MWRHSLFNSRRLILELNVSFNQGVMALKLQHSKILPLGHLYLRCHAWNSLVVCVCVWCVCCVCVCVWCVCVCVCVERERER